MKQSARLFVHNLWGPVQDETWDPLLESSKNFNCRASDWAPSKSRALCNWAGHVKLAVPLASRKQSSWDAGTTDQGSICYPTAPIPCYSCKCCNHCLIFTFCKQMGKWLPFHFPFVCHQSFKSGGLDPEAFSRKQFRQRHLTLQIRCFCGHPYPVFEYLD